MDENAELGIAKPFRRLIRAQTLPIVAKGAARYALVDIGEETFAFTIVFGIGSDPLRIDLLRGKLARGRRSRIRRLRLSPPWRIRQRKRGNQRHISVHRA